MLVKHQIEIDAPILDVWNLWADLEGWPVWYPGMKAVTKKTYGKAAVGTKFAQKMDVGGGRTVSLKTELCTCSEPNKIGWKGGAPGMKVVHTIFLDDVGGRTRVRSEETWDGFLSPLAALIRERIDDVTINCLEGLKAHAERVAKKP